MAHNRDKYPAIWAEMEAAREKLAPLEAKRQKHMDAMNKVAEEIEVLRAKKNTCHVKACADWDEIATLRREVARLAKAMGAPTA